ncbi:hypothetical protein HYPSUDRAFT_196048 [Hypholoma sublateritium FD-334 SS-4]|uniref:Uncharacterized protein n=1 Tax=Hypholoma sublateritium (strain FD-334 SS-4) TaxID=945553 RepID=A0A0D2PNF1_HYPSF|nr:hypothetical protein HYPSUDRAFT_196048 [Hypholoma sublateritium FD-334 SS-4]
MLSSLGTPRPLPPAKARKASAMQKMSSSPPPAYGSPFTFPARRQLRQNILGSPMATTFQMVGWDSVGDNEQLNGTVMDDVAWMNEKSREELKDLLLKADVLIKERENELGITSAVCKGLFQNNVALKSKHEELLSRIPTSPARSTSSPSNLDYHSLLPEDSINLTTSFSESHVDRIRTPSPNLYRRHARKVSIAAADVSLLSDQNAELLDKLEKLEKEATSADQAGRRELKRLEKEITFLREALEKTQARSDELEEKVQGAVASQAWRRKKEREAKFRAMRNLGRGPSDSDANDQENKVQNFAPEGSTFGGPSETFSFFPMAESPDVNRRRKDNDNVVEIGAQLNSLKPHEHALISQLLVKVQELEEANAKILQQQSDTATQLSAVQRDTAHMSRVYECLADPDSVELELADAGCWYEDGERGDRLEIDSTTGQAICFRSLKRSLASEMEALRGTCIIHPEFTSSGKTRKTVIGLFDVEVPITEDQDGESQHSSEDVQPSSISASESPWSEGRNSSWSSGIGGIDAVPSTRLSPLHFFSPPSQILAELSPLGGRPTLETELARELNGTWADMQERNNEYPHNDHLRKSSLYDLSQLSVPPSPSPTSRAISRRASDELDYDVMRKALSMGTEDASMHTPRSASLIMPANSLQLSVEPPTPERHRIRQLQAGQSADPCLSSRPRSPRVTLMSDVLRSRSNRWVDRRFRHWSSERSLERVADAAFGRDGDAYTVASYGASSALAIPKRLMTAVDNMIGGFDSAIGISAADVDAEDSDDGRVLAPATPRAHEPRAHARRRSGGRGAYDRELDALTEPLGACAEMQLHADASPRKSSVDYEQQGVLLRVWLWVQFAIVVFVFLYAMARRGPTTVLVDGDKHKKAVSRRR